LVEKTIWRRIWAENVTGSGEAFRFLEWLKTNVNLEVTRASSAAVLLRPGCLLDSTFWLGLVK
jgi:hypothetical protein